MIADWTISRYPAPYRFAFTIVHDADSAYSQRLAPLFDTFDALGLQVTVSAFAFWADWARNGDIWSEWRTASAFDAPVAVPFCDPIERRFYQDLASRGHEVALHTPSDTSNTREQIIAAFEAFKDTFGHYPSVYTEHSSKSNKDAQSNEGADASSAYYCREVLLQYDPWVWVDGDGALPEDSDEKFFEIPPTAPLVNQRARARYGLANAFVRTGKWSWGDGDGFLAGYSKENIDTLERDGGIALAYTHLNAGWLDPNTRQMRDDIQQRLRYLADKGGWFVPAGEILDRARAIDSLQVVRQGHRIALTNTSEIELTDVSLRSPGRETPFVVGALRPGETQWLGETLDEE